MKETKVLNIKITAIGSHRFKNVISDFLSDKDSKKVAKVNTEFLLRAKENEEFQKTLDSFDLNIADGKGVLWAARYLSLPLTKAPILRRVQAIWQMVYSGASLVFYPRYCQDPIPENIPGLDAMYLMLDAVQESRAGVYFFGAEKDVLQKAITNIQAKYPELKVSGYRNGYDYEDEEIVDSINKSKARLLIVALGSPKQEYWIRDNLARLETIKVAVGEGGSLDFVAGSTKRAPKWMQKVGIEWFWRLFMNRNKSVNTNERAKRVWRAVPVFIYNVVKFRLKK